MKKACVEWPFLQSSRQRVGVAVASIVACVLVFELLGAGLFVKVVPPPRPAVRPVSVSSLPFLGRSTASGNVSALMNTGNASDVVVVVAHHKEDVSWLQEQPYPYVLMVKGKPLGTPNNTPGTKRGREAASYLQFIVDNYDNLPKRMVFMHPHRRAWHTKDEVLLLNSINPFAYEFAALSRLYHKQLLPEYFKQVSVWYDQLNLTQWVKEPFPTNRFGFRMVCCAMFVVSNTRVEAAPLAMYETILDWLLTTNTTDYVSGRYLEWTWHGLFGEPWAGFPPDPEMLCPLNPAPCRKSKF